MSLAWRCLAGARTPDLLMKHVAFSACLQEICTVLVSVCLQEKSIEADSECLQDICTVLVSVLYVCKKCVLYQSVYICKKFVLY